MKRADETLRISSLRQLKALADPIRYRILEELTVKARTALQMAEILGTKPTRLYHHFRVLQRAGLIRPAGTKKIRGTTEKYFRAAADRIALDTEALGDTVLATSSAVTGVLHTTMQEMADAERAARESGAETMMLVKRLRLQPRGKDVARMIRAIETCLEKLESMATDEEGEDFALTLAFYRKTKND